MVKVSDFILESLRLEVESVKTTVAKRGYKPDGEGAFRCPLCPFRSFRPQKNRLEAHLQRHHVLTKQWVPSGTKQVKVTPCKKHVQHSVSKHDSQLKGCQSSFGIGCISKRHPSEYNA